MHVACALLLGSELFLTTDLRQAHLAKSAGLQIVRRQDFGAKRLDVWQICLAHLSRLRPFGFERYY
jgi:hypothetical protein